MNIAPDHQTTTATARGSLGSLQAGRGIAALLVVLFHCNGIFNAGEYFKASPFGRFFEFGDSGVYFFFVLSGFIIFHAHARDIGRGGRLRNYLTRRIIRIYPLYLVVMATILPVYFIHPQFGDGSDRDFWNILSSLTLISDGTGAPILAVSWTLFHEIMFYILFGTLVRNARLGTVILTTWIAISPLFLNTASARLGFFLSPLHLLFGMGIAANIWLRSGRPLPSRLFAIAGTGAFLAIGMDRAYLGSIPGPVLPLAYGAAATLAVLGMAMLETSGRLQVPAWLLLLGDASYSIYLVHFPALSALAKIFGRLAILPPSVSFVAMVLCATAIGCATHMLLERPLLAYLRRRTTPPPRHDIVILPW